VNLPRRNFATCCTADARRQAGPGLLRPALVLLGVSN
jgi:hypothetical protein